MTAAEYLFLDTEWANDAQRELVSLALVSRDGTRRFYAERDPLPDNPSRFVADIVYPLLERGEAAMPDADFTRGLRRFLSQFDAPFVLFDVSHDGDLLTHALNGFGAPGNYGPMPTIGTTRMLREGDFHHLLQAWFAQQPEREARRHHAGVDAEALRCAWLAVTGRDYLTEGKP